MYSISWLHSLTFKAVMQFGKPLLHTHSTEQYYFKLVLFTTTRVSNTCRAVVASPVIPVSVVTCLASHCSTMLKHVRWLQTVRQNCSASLSSKNFLFLQENDSLANWRLWLLANKWTRLESWHQWCMTQWAERVDIHVKPYRLASDNHHGLRSNLIAPKFSNF